MQIAVHRPSLDQDQLEAAHNPKGLKSSNAIQYLVAGNHQIYDVLKVARDAPEFQDQTILQHEERMFKEHIKSLFPQFTSLKQILQKRWKKPSHSKKEYRFQNTTQAQNVEQKFSMKFHSHRLEYLNDSVSKLSTNQFEENNNRRAFASQKSFLCNNPCVDYLRRIFCVVEADNPMPQDSDEDQDEDEVDPEVVENERKEMARLARLYCNSSLNQFGLDSQLRRQCIGIIENPWFDNFIIFLIALNSVLLGLSDYTIDKNAPQDKIPFFNKLVETTEIFFTFAFTSEAIIKIIAYGFIFGGNCYLRDAWNWLDFIVVVTGLMQILPQMQNMSALRTFRLFRPLKTLSTLP